MGSRLAVFMMVCAPVAGFACGGGDQATAGGSKVPTQPSTNVLTHEDCSESGHKVELLDTNNDGKPDIRRVFGGNGREICRSADLNHDGKIDLYEYFDSSGNVRRREYCYDDTGTVNAVEIYQGGKLAQRMYDTAGLPGTNKIDTWDWFDTSAPLDAKTGRTAHPSRRERDTTGSGKVDQWWTWNGDQVSIAVDANGDGKPDPSSTLVLDKNGSPVQPGDNGSSAPPATSSAAPAASSAPASAASSGPAPASSGASAASAAPAGSAAPASSGGTP
jgi:hypothetical protein